MHSELQHAENDSRLEGVVSPHFVQYVTTYLEAFQHGIVDLGTLAFNASRFVINELDQEATISIIIELEVTMLENLTIIALGIRTLYHVVSFHVDEFDLARDSALCLTHTVSSLTCT